jgi:hypothetical protein
VVDFSGCLMDAPSSWPPFTIAVVARCDICWHSRVVIARSFFERHGGPFSIELPLCAGGRSREGVRVRYLPFQFRFTKACYLFDST